MRDPSWISTSSAPSDNPTPMDLLHNSAIAAGMSGNARALLTKIVLWSGVKGFCWWSVSKIARESSGHSDRFAGYFESLKRPDILLWSRTRANELLDTVSQDIHRKPD